MNDFDPAFDCEDADIHCPPPVIDGCTCPCHKQRPTLAETVTGYIMLFGLTALLVWLLHTLACTHV